MVKLLVGRRDVKLQLLKLWENRIKKGTILVPFFISRGIYNGMIIYKITNKINNKIYIGKSCNNDENYLGSGISINNAINKYGRDNFIKEVIEVYQEEESLNNREKFWIKEYNSTNRKIGYNIAEGGNGGNTRLGYTELELNDYYKKISNGLENSQKYKESIENRKGKKNPKISMKLKELYGSGKIKSWNVGIKTNEETKKKISEKNLGKKMTEIAKKKISESKYVGVIMLDINNNIINEFDSIKTASEIMKINRCCISDCLNGRQKTAGGYKWKFS